jgi:hypothetical protein
VRIPLAFRHNFGIGIDRRRLIFPSQPSRHFFFLALFSLLLFLALLKSLWSTTRHMLSPLEMKNRSPGNSASRRAVDDYVLYGLRRWMG